jgi:hypothetical protein
MQVLTDVPGWFQQEYWQGCRRSCAFEREQMQDESLKQ